MKYFLPIFCFTFILSLAQYDPYLYFVAFLMGIIYTVHKLTDNKDKEELC